jgi:hypothetical protein
MQGKANTAGTTTKAPRRQKSKKQNHSQTNETNPRDTPQTPFFSTHHATRK